MKLNELFEELKAQVYRNKDSTLTVLPHYVARKMKAANYLPSNSCLAVQVISSVAASVNVPEDVIAKQLKYKLSGSRGIRGQTLEEIVHELQDATFNDRGEKFKLKLSVRKYTTIDDALAAVERGQAVVMIVNTHGAIRNAVDQLERGRTPFSKTGIINVYPDEEVISDSYSLFHSMVIFGIDHAHKHVLARETRETYGMKGFTKISYDVLKQHPKLVQAYLGVVVEGKKRVE